MPLAGESRSSAHSRDRDEAALAGKGRANGVGDSGNSGYEPPEAVVVDRNDGDGRKPLFRRHALVSGNQSREAGALRYGQEFAVRERAPVVVDRGLDRDTAKLLLERLAQAWRHPDIKQNLHARESGASGAVGIAGCGGADGRRSGAQDGGGRPAINLEVLQELVQRNAVLDPVE